MSWLFEPRIFNIIIMGLSAAAAVRWALIGNWWAALYWAAATAITFAATGGITR